MTLKAKLSALLETASYTTIDSYKIALSSIDENTVRLEIETEESDQGLVTVVILPDQELEVDATGKAVAEDSFGDECEFIFSMLRPISATDMSEPEGNRLRSIFEGKTCG